MAKPIITSMIVCDNIYRDQGSQKCVLSGTFSHIFGFKFPTNQVHLAIYIALTDISEEGKLQVIFKREDVVNNFTFPLPVWKVPAMSPDKRNRTIELCGNVAGLPLPEPGEYEFSAFWNDTPIGSKRLSVIFLKPVLQPPKTE